MSLTVMTCSGSNLPPMVTPGGPQTLDGRVSCASSPSSPTFDARLTVSSTPPSSAAHDDRARGSAVAATPLRTVVELTEGRRVGPRADRHASVDDVTHDSRDAAPGVLFACRPGAVADGHDFAADAVARGAPALLVERPLELAVPQVQVDSVARRLGPVAAAVHGDPTAHLDVVGVTGTNGKTTCATLLEGVLAASGARTGLIGTVTTRIAGRDVPGVRTTPEATDLQRLFARMRAADVTAVAMEVSSHGLALGRVDGTRFSVAVFTNLTHDHLDFHHTMDAYYAAKARLFMPALSSAGVVNIDDEAGRRLVREAQIPVTTVSLGAQADVMVARIDPTAAGSAITVRIDGVSHELEIGLPGRFNVSNAAVVLASARLLGVPFDAVATALGMPWAVPGRMERIDEGQPFTVLVDYAHTPDSLTRVLAATREIVDGRVLVAIGCGGDRDQDKRPAMGAAAVAGADQVVFTSDNPRGEDPTEILAAIVAGAGSTSGGTWSVEADRQAAIAQLLAAARPGDAVVIAGKGHETGQQFADRTIDFDDRAVARDVLRQQ